MADFCQQCSIEMFGDDTRDMAGLSTQEETENGLSIPVICEGCGYTLVDHEGRCVSPYCKKHQSVSQSQSHETA